MDQRHTADTDNLEVEEDQEPSREVDPAEPERQVELGFMFCHSVVSENTQNLIETASAAFAVGELLVEQGVLKKEKYEERRQEIHARLLKQIEGGGLGLYLNEEHSDKYALTDLPVINCAERIHLCHAACCALRFPLSRQDVEQGIVRWDLGRPYWNLRNGTGYCVHWQVGSAQCGVYKDRPAPCRLYSCRDDKRIWKDFEAMIISEDLEAALNQPMSDSFRSADRGPDNHGEKVAGKNRLD